MDENLIKMVVKSVNKNQMKIFVLVSKVLPMVLALCHLLNCVFGYFGWNNVILGYISGISILTVSYLYFVSYLIKLCGYYRMFLHYCIVIDIINIYDYYIGIPVNDRNLMFLYGGVTIISMFIIIYMKFFMVWKRNID